MATKTELINEAQKLAAALNIEINTDNFKSAQLKKLVSDLKAKTKDAENPAAEMAQAAAQADSEAEAEKKKSVNTAYTVETGKSIVTKRGVLSAGAEIKASDLGGGDNAIKSLLAKKYIKAK